MSFVVMKRAKVRAAASVESAVCGFLETDEVVVVGARTEVEHKQRLRIVDCPSPPRPRSPLGFLKS